MFLERAREHGADLGDMRELPWTSRFDAVINWFTAFGYFDDPDNKRVLAEVVKALRPGGLFVLDHTNLTALLNDYPRVASAERDACHHVIGRTLVHGDRVHRTRWFVRMFTFPELRDWLPEAGFTKVDGYGEDGEPLTFAHRHMVVVARL